MKEFISEIVNDSIRAKQNFLGQNITVLQEIVLCVAQAFRRGAKLMLFGNGGSAADAQHIAAEFVNRFILDRPPLPAIALTTDSSVITSISNDFSFDDVFSKQIRALGRKGDAALGISTSGRSPNVISALRTASEMEITTIGFAGGGESPMKQFCEHYLSACNESTPRIQEIHALCGHILAESVDELLYGRFSSKDLGTGFTNTFSHNK